MSAASIPIPAIPPVAPLVCRNGTTLIMRSRRDAQSTRPPRRMASRHASRACPTCALLMPSADDLVAGEELRDLLRGGVGRVRTMHRILADRFGMHLADGAGR